MADKKDKAPKTTKKAGKDDSEKMQALAEEADHFFKFNMDDEPGRQADIPDGLVWTASEFVAHDKSAGWYIMLSIVTAIAAAAVFLITKDKVSVGVVILAAIIFGVYASHKPRELEYRLDQKGIGIDKKQYYFKDFRSFSLIPEGAFSSIVLMPLKRFAPPLSVYFAPEDEEKIKSILAGSLPFEQRRRDAVDSLMHRVRF